MKRAIFLDRDGVLNELVLNPKNGEHESPHDVADVHMLPGAAEAAKKLQDAGYVLFIVSNQPSYAKGKTSLEQIQAIERLVESHLRESGVEILRAYYCYHHPDGIVPEYSGACRCRKPKPQFLFDARDEFGIELSESWMIGDQDTDVQCGRRAGCRTVAVANPLSAHRRPGAEKPTLTARDLADAVEKILDFCGSAR
ncbi:MAG TPA: HAD family hydrolase [Planctomycetota bacterium]|nr:HAD family hydrolase [Planctomycetota bacterium]